jgi:molybdenum cofactor cytidylyltransferase
MKTSSCNKIAAVILAAGEGKRFGGCKATAMLDGVTFLEIIAKHLQKVECEPIVVVCGRDSDKVKDEAARLEIDYAINSDWEKGQFSSLKCGLSKIKDDVCGALVTLVDHPFVAGETYALLKDGFVKRPNRIIIPVHNYRRGHPIILPRDIINQIILSPDDVTMRDIIKNHESMVVQFRCEDPGVLKDIDTKDDLEKARKE